MTISIRECILECLLGVPGEMGSHSQVLPADFLFGKVGTRHSAVVDVLIDWFRVLSTRRCRLPLKSMIYLFMWPSYEKWDPHTAQIPPLPAESTDGYGSQEQFTLKMWIAFVTMIFSPTVFFFPPFWGHSTVSLASVDRGSASSESLWEERALVIWSSFVS